MRRSWSYLSPWLFALPALALFALLTVYPIVFAARISFTNWNGLSDSFSWVGLTNYGSILRDPLFLRATINTFFIVAFTVLVQNGSAFLLALEIEGVKQPIMRSVFRTIFFLPALLALPVAGIIWSWVFDPFRGPINILLGSLNLPQPLWLGEYPINLIAILIVNWWMWTGYNALIFSAGIQGLPGDVIEAARIDGAQGWTLTRYITLPLLRPIVAVVTVTTMINGLKSFGLIYVLTGGGPANQSHTWATLLFQRAFSFGEYGSATAIGMVMFVVAFLLTFVYLRLLREGE